MGLFLQQEAASRALDSALPAVLPLGLVGLWRWGMWVFRVIGWFMYRVQSPRPDDKFKTTDVSLIVPTIDCDEEALTEAIRSWVLNEPFEILIVTDDTLHQITPMYGAESARKALQDIVDKSLGSGITRVVVSPVANKRVQLVVGIKESYGKLACFTDDDAIWNSYFLKYLLAPFNDDKMGGTGSNQIMRPCRMDVPPTTFERIGDMRLSSRMLEAAASTFYDGSVSCLSGRTALYHKRILAPLENFEKEFCNEYWLKSKLMSGDDKFMTRWVVKKGWRMRMQLSPECTLATTFKSDGKFFKQILRWTRNTWRSDFKSLVLERIIWWRYPVQAVLMVDRMISPFTLSAGPILFCLAIVYLSDFVSWSDYVVTVCIYFLWILVSRTVRMTPHFWRVPEDFTYLPMFILYQYFFAALKLYAAFTLNNTAWGTRDANAFKTPEQIAAEMQSGSSAGKSLLSQKSDPTVLAKAVPGKIKRSTKPREKQANGIQNADARVTVRRTPPPPPGGDQQSRGSASGGEQQALRGSKPVGEQQQAWQVMEQQARRGAPAAPNGWGRLQVARGANDPMVPSPKRC